MVPVLGNEQATGVFRSGAFLSQPTICWVFDRGVDWNAQAEKTVREPSSSGTVPSGISFSKDPDAATTKVARGAILGPPRIYLGRVAGRYRHRGGLGRVAFACRPSGPRSGSPDELWQQFEAARSGVAQL